MKIAVWKSHINELRNQFDDVHSARAGSQGSRADD
ncbi:unnamed protein product [Urochloa humidicola]